MYQMNELELWNERRRGLVRETEKERLTRSLRTVRSKRLARFMSALLATLRAEGGRA